MRPGGAQNALEAIAVEHRGKERSNPLATARRDRAIDEHEHAKLAVHRAVTATSILRFRQDQHGQVAGPRRIPMSKVSVFRLPVGQHIVPGGVAGYYIDLRSKAETARLAAGMVSVPRISPLHRDRTVGVGLLRALYRRRRRGVAERSSRSGAVPS